MIRTQKLKIEEKVVHIAQRNQKRGVKKKSVNREKHEKDRAWKRHNAYGRRSISCICWLPIVLQ
jgi:hypothetical protein